VRVLLLGPPGSGKGTQGQALARRLGIGHLSSGELLRREAAAGTELGRQVAAYLDRGELVPDDLVIAVMRHALRSTDRSNGYVLDGFPRNVAQAEQADALEATGGVADEVVYLALPDDVARQRLAGRAAEGRSDDADPDVIDRRLRVFHAETEPLLDLYRDRGILWVVDADEPAEAVTAAILAALAPADGDTERP
jgi:adenylate kinase